MQKPQVPVVIVAGMGVNRVIGKENGLLWHVPADLKRFKALTLGHPVIMGRKTFESIIAILGKPLPGRTNIVITRNPDYAHEGVITVTSLEEAFTVAMSEGPSEIHIGGGEEIYRQALPFTDRLHLTFFAEEKDGDAFFPDFAADFIVNKEYPKEEHVGVEYQWVDFARKTI
jgi:dihydrofolate reductase